LTEIFKGLLSVRKEEKRWPGFASGATTPTTDPAKKQQGEGESFSESWSIISFIVTAPIPLAT